jgi:glycosyltransferase involved in cell wall biosynthesis
MSFFFDCRFIRVDHHDGISRFSSELFKSFSKTKSVTAIISDMQQLKELPHGTNYFLANDPKNPLLELFLPRRLNRQGAGIVFSPMQTMGSFGKKYKLILTLHDLIYYKHRKPPVFLAWPIRLAWRLFHLSFTPVRLLLNRADAVVTISETTKTLIERNRLTHRPVTVVYNASSMPVVELSKTEPRTKNLVYMGSFMPYKNVEILIKGMEDLPEFTLTLCSKIDPKRRDQLLASSSQEARSRIAFVNGMSESKYLELLDGSFALVTASKDEGFGIPVIEAMSRSIPVALSDIEIFREVASEAGHFFDPESPSSFALAVKSLDAIGSWQNASKTSLERARAFSWDDSARKLNHLLESLKY